MKNVVKTSSTNALKDAIKGYLKKYQEEGAYIADRSLYAGFGNVFKDGMNAYSEYDLFVERIYKPKFIKKIDKDISHYDKLDMDILDVYTENINFIRNVAEMVVEAEPEEVEKAKTITTDIEKIIPTLKPVTDTVSLPFFVNNITEEEIPLITMANVTEEALEEWAEKLAMFVECHKSIVTPVLMSGAASADGLTVYIVNSVYWYDIVVR